MSKQMELKLKRVVEAEPEELDAAIADLLVMFNGNVAVMYRVIGRLVPMFRDALMGRMVDHFLTFQAELIRRFHLFFFKSLVLVLGVATALSFILPAGWVIGVLLVMAAFSLVGILLAYQEIPRI